MLAIITIATRKTSKCWPGWASTPTGYTIEWSRIEPEPGLFSSAELNHYRRVLECCHQNSLHPMVTLSHFTTPRWFAAQGGWDQDVAPDLFTRYAERSARHLGDLISSATTFNEPNIPFLLSAQHGYGRRVRTAD